MPDDPKSLYEYGVLGTILAVLLGLFTKFLVKVFGDHGAREKRLSERISVLESFVNTTLIEVIKHDSEVMQRCLKALEENAEIFKELVRLTDMLTFRPCLLPDGHPPKIEAAKKLLVQLEDDKNDKCPFSFTELVSDNNESNVFDY